MISPFEKGDVMIIVFGSLNVDLIMRCSVLPKPGETVLSPSYQTFPGGKGANQAVAARKFGAEVKMVGSVGDDDFGKLLFTSLIDHGVDTSGVWFGHRETGCASICVDQKGENIIIVAQGANAEASADMLRPEWLSPQVYFLLQMEVPLAENWRALKIAKSRKAKTVVSLAPFKIIPPSVFEDIDILITNQHEASELLKHTDMTSEEFVQKHNLVLIITLGEKGAHVITLEEAWLCPAPKVQAIDTVGAGDTFSGVLAAALDEGEDLRKAVIYAVTASSLACTRREAQKGCPTRQEVEEALLVSPPV